MILNKEKALKVYSEYDTVYGPYLNKLGRLHVIFTKHEGGKIVKRHTVSYPKLLVEIENGEVLQDGMTVDHIDRDFTNNDLSNLRVLSREEHSSVDAKRVKPILTTCPWCKIEFEIDVIKQSEARRLRKNNKVGPFCNRSCAGKYGKHIQKGGDRLVNHHLPKVEYYVIEKNSPD